ncbi:MAG TPA: RsmE family RNA methyltransferase [Bacteroidia bacterium]|nr:RsmE family RNA methyltransferase [Bacteroidia bacterium]HNT79460.1 RsmE family RNA methyltransferase [Bacteroidia bacterium]
MQVFYSHNIEGESIALSPTDAAHVSRVLRMKIGDELIVTDGSGKAIRGAIVEISKEVCIIQASAKIDSAPRQERKISIALALLKNQDRIEWFIEKGCELGIHEFLLFTAQRSERKSINTDRLQKKIIESCKQSHNYNFPKLRIIKNTQDLINMEYEGEKYIAHCDEMGKATIRNNSELPKRILIGPEGDFTEEEKNIAIQKGYNAVSLGPLRLRSETAALYALMLLKNI